MRKISYLFTAFLMLSITFYSCDNNDDITPTEVNAIKLENPINDFVWKGMNSWYNWQTSVPNLSDNKDDDQDAYYTYLNGYSDPEDLFSSLLYNKGTTDRNSWFIEDYNVQDASFRGVNDAYGFEFKLARLCQDCEEVIGYVTYVVPNSPANDAEMLRGDMFYKFDGTALTINNYTIVNAFYKDDVSSISLTFNTLVDGVITPNGKESTLIIREVVENPVLYSDIITTTSGVKVGYLVYNGFKYTFHQELNDAFGVFKSEGIQELVLDLRYNGGGSVLTSAYLASMIYAGATTNDVFGKLIYNSKHNDESGAYPFFDEARIYNKDGSDSKVNIPINRLNTLSKLYVITSGDTASASEMIINGLAPYFSVIKIGTTTYGKNVGSTTLYDSPDFSAKNINPNHTNAMQPIVFQIYNKLNQSDYSLGFSPDYEVVEYASEIKAFGDLNEPLLKTALNLISGVSAKSSNKKYQLENIQIFNSIENKPFSKEMYIIPNENNLY